MRKEPVSQHCDPNLLAALDTLDLPAAALSEGEFDRIYQSARARLPRVQKEAAPKRCARKFQYTGDYQTRL